MALPTTGSGPIHNAIRHSARADTAQYNYAADLDTDDVLYLNNTNAVMRVRAITARPSTAGTHGSAVTVAIAKAASGTAASGGTALHSGTIDLKGTVDTDQELTLSTTAGALTIPPGTAVVLTLTGDATSAAGIIAVDLIPY